jgi:hypothetical protein
MTGTIKINIAQLIIKQIRWRQLEAFDAFHGVCSRDFF